MDPARADDALSPLVGIVLMVAVTVILAAIILALLSWLPHLCDPFPPSVIKIEEIHDYNEAGTKLTYASRVLLRNFGTKDLPNRQITGAFYSDGKRVQCTMKSFHGEDYPDGFHRSGFKTMGGEGCRGLTWEAGASVLIDFNERTFMPGQTVRVDIIDSGTGCVISSDSFRRGPDPVR
ncbi:MAG: type IV pilin [Methanospirillum sp.]